MFTVKTTKMTKTVITVTSPETRNKSKGWEGFLMKCNKHITIDFR